MCLPCVVSDIHSYLLYEYKNKEDIFAIGSISRDKFIEVSENKKDIVMQAIDLMDGNHSFESIRNEINNSTGKTLNVENLYEILKKADLIYKKNDSCPKKNEFETLGFKIFEFRIEKFRRFFLSFSTLVIPSAFLILGSIIFSLIFCIINSRDIPPVSLLGIKGNYLIYLISILIIMTISISFHEIAHGVVASRYGIIPKKLSLSLYLFVSPIVYIKLPGLYAIKPRERINVWMAGVTVNSFFVCIGIVMSIILNHSGASEFIINITSYIWYINLIFVIVNLCPLMPLDGYFVLATLMKIPNLRTRSFASIRNSIKNRTIQITVWQGVYFLLSIMAMGYIFLKEIFTMIHTFMENVNNGIGYAFWTIKQYIIIILVMITIKVIRSKVLSRR